ncbi:hypothetical protein HanPI659440_Chr09g0332491 [Helianthus annuus]|nr:hypothetical protein HanPI659440_Chr09g0332491 [Helianthus annuus]
MQPNVRKRNERNTNMKIEGERQEGGEWRWVAVGGQLAKMLKQLVVFVYTVIVCCSFTLSHFIFYVKLLKY